MAELEKILLEFPTEKWNWKSLSANPNITINFIKAHKMFPWNFKELSRNTNLTLKFIKEYLDFDWDWTFLLQSSLITVDFIIQYIGHFHWNNDIVSLNPNLTNSFVQKYGKVEYRPYEIEPIKINPNHTKYPYDFEWDFHFRDFVCIHFN
jgi:hypothetical protein